MKKTADICHLTNIRDYILTDKTYQTLQLESQETFILSLFHSTNWSKIQKEDRVILLRELERIEAKKLKREPFHIKLLDSNYKWDDFYMDFCVDKKNKKIYSRKNFVEDGIMQVLDDKKIKRVKIARMNYELLDCLFHEQYHIMTDYYLKKYRTSMEDAYKEHSEYIIWGSRKGAMDVYNNQEMMRKRHYIYRMIPEEYYAFQYAEEKVQRVFCSLKEDYGEDQAYDEYLIYLKKSKESVVANYYENCNDTSLLTYDELYQKLLDSYIKDFEKECPNVSGTKEDLCIRKSIIKENRKRNIK